MTKVAHEISRLLHAVQIEANIGVIGDLQIRAIYCISNSERETKKLFDLSYFERVEKLEIDVAR